MIYVAQVAGEDRVGRAGPTLTLRNRELITFRRKSIEEYATHMLNILYASM